MYRSALIIISLFISGCAGTNTIEYFLNKELIPKLIHENGFQSIKWVKLHNNGDVDICIIGNQIKENSEHTIKLRKSLYAIHGFGIPDTERENFYKTRDNETIRAQASKKYELMAGEDPDILLYGTDFILGCSGENYDGDTFLRLSKRKFLDNFYHIETNKNLVEAVYENSKGEHFDSLAVRFWYEGRPYNTVSIELSLNDKTKEKYHCRNLQNEDRGDNIVVGIPMCSSIKNGVEYMTRYQNLFIAPKLSHNEYNSKLRRYQTAGFLIDVITSPIQVPYYLVCSVFGCNGWVNEPNLNIHI